MQTKLKREMPNLIIAVVLASLSQSVWSGPNTKHDNDGAHNSLPGRATMTWSDEPGRPRSLPDLQVLYAVFKQSDAREREAGTTPKSSGSNAADAERWTVEDDQIQASSSHYLKLAAERRVIMQDLFESGDRLSATPEPNGEVELLLTPNGGRLIGAPESHGLLYQLSFTPPYSMFVYGMVGDDVVAVNLVAAGKTVSAKMSENAFALEAMVEKEMVKPEQLHLNVHLRDGSVETYDSIQERYELAVRPEEDDDDDL